jgi:hypothetical protein
MTDPAAHHGAERRRLEDDGAAWRRWGPYLSERAWGTVREDYSEGGTAWESFPHEHARSRAYRWNEDGLAGVCDEHQELCFALAFWNGRDPILKERIYGLTGNEGNHGEDAKEYWWFLDSTPTHSFMRWAYAYPQDAFPYAELLERNRGRGRLDPEFELLDTGIFDRDRYWDIEVRYAKADPEDLCIEIRVRNAGPDEETLTVLPTLWFRNRWSWGLPDAPEGLQLWDRNGVIVAEGLDGGPYALAGEGGPQTLFCDNETNSYRLWGVPSSTPFPKDGINDHVVDGLPSVNPARRGTKAALRYDLTVAPGEVATIRLRLASVLTDTTPDLTTGWERTFALREQEADGFYAEVTPPGTPAEEALVLRQALAGMLWSKQFFNYDVDQWLDGDPSGPPPPAARLHGRNADWRHLNTSDVISMPDPWEYPWFAAWDLAFHCTALALVDPRFAKDQLLLMLREWYMHPNGQIPAYEWAFGDVNPPVHAWAALRVFLIDGERDVAFLEQVMHKLLINFTWWVNRKDAEGNNVFEGGFLGLDNIGPIDRSAALPVAGHLEQSDGTAWMAGYCLAMWWMALVLAEHNPTYEDLVTKFFEHFAYIASAIYEQGLWDEDDGFFYDVLHLEGGQRVPLRVRSMVGLLPLVAATTLGTATRERLPQFSEHLDWFLEHKPRFAQVVGNVHVLGGNEGRLFCIADPDRLRKILARMLDPEEFLSPYGLRALSKAHEAAPFDLHLDGMTFRVDYEPGESTTGLFGGNSNWRGPIWFPVNYMVIHALRRYHAFLGDDFTVEHPTGSGVTMNLEQVADDLSRRLVATFLDDANDRRPVFGPYTKLQEDPAWHDRLLFHEYFHGDTGMGLGAAHQTGWTGLVANLIVETREGWRSYTEEEGG